MKKINNYINKYSLIFITFFIINLFFIWIISNILIIDNKLKASNSLMSRDAKTIYYYGSNYSEKDIIIDELSGKKAIAEVNIQTTQNHDSIDAKAIYYNYEINTKYPLLEGRMFTLDEIKNKEKVALVGKSFKDDIKENYIKFEGEQYKVVGVLGLEGSAILENSIFINLCSKELNLSMRAINIDILDEDTISVATDIANIFSDSNSDAYIISEPYGLSDPLKTAMLENNIHIVLAVLVSICLITTIFNIGSYWINKEQVVIGIKSLVGGSRIKIIMELWLEYISTIISALILSNIIVEVVSLLSNIQSMIRFREIIVLLTLNIIISTIAFIGPIINYLKLNINTVIKENI